MTYLQSILQYFSDAAQSFMRASILILKNYKKQFFIQYINLKEDCIKQAESCIKKARLIALQINFLSSNLVIVNINQYAVTEFIVNHDKFWEAFIVSEAYDRKSDWPWALFNQFILNSNEKYLVDFKVHLQISSNIIEEVSNRYKSWLERNSPTPQIIDNMKRLLKYSKDLAQYYRLVSNLEFKDLLIELQAKKYSSIIKDLIASKRI